MAKKFPEQVQPTQIAYISGRPKTLHLRTCKLVREMEDGTIDEFEFDRSSITIGAMDDHDIVLNDDTVSRYHCRIAQDGDCYIITDNDSTNGTFVNRVRIREAYLRPGCVISVGKTDLRFHTVDEKVEILPSSQESFGDIVGRSVRIREVFGILEKIAPTDVTVVIEAKRAPERKSSPTRSTATVPEKTSPLLFSTAGQSPKALSKVSSSAMKRDPSQVPS